MTDIVEGALQTADGQWRVEAVNRNGHRSYQIRHGDDLIKGLDLDVVERSSPKPAST